MCSLAYGTFLVLECVLLPIVDTSGHGETIISVRSECLLAVRLVAIDSQACVDPRRYALPTPHQQFGWKIGLVRAKKKTQTHTFSKVSALVLTDAGIAGLS